ncbi:OLC1v1000735C1 [Oldenlandia corymbosa var. corymbosa]|uniref:OLC1v1000735C1 n=1 Tax=Oldenlandia corymbosa var. corymbosa TaxID=529605 RepID=A0AAV1D643_OLDCO|nr:OLC1v1000735C1 [Oldenlandia corymbosa var. corymbosa]
MAGSSFGLQPSENMGSTTKGVTVEAPKRVFAIDFKILGLSIFSFLPWNIGSGNKIQMPATISKELKKHARAHRGAKSLDQYPSVRFRPYVSKVPWHTGPRAVLSQMFPRYGHYCGPNWSSGKDRGSHVWDKRPIDWLDFCCYCHDIGYDTHDQAELLKADLAFLECLEKSDMKIKGNPWVANLYKTMCISGLRNVLIPYRHQLVNLRAVQSPINFGWIGNWKLQALNIQKDMKIDLSFVWKGWLRNVRWKGQNHENL